MAKSTPEQRKKAINRNEMLKTWLSYQYLLEEDLKRLDYRIYKMYQEARGFGVEHEYIQDFIRANMEILINETVKRREAEEIAKRRQRV